MASVKTASNEKAYLDNSGHRPAVGRMWPSDTGHLSAVTGLSCRGSLRAVCPVLPGCLLGWPHVEVEVWASWKASLKLLESQPEASAKHSSKDKSHTRERSGSQGWSLGGPLQSPSSWNSRPNPGARGGGAQRPRGWKAKGTGFSLRPAGSVTLARWPCSGSVSQGT